MNDSELASIFKDLQKKGQIHPSREIKPSPQQHCSFFSHAPLDGIREILVSIKLSSSYIGYDRRKIEFLDDKTSRFVLLHEEGHMRYFIDKLDWDDKKIDRKSIQYTPQLWRENEFKADKYAARGFLTIYPEIDPCETMHMLFEATRKCREKHKISPLTKKIQKLWRKLMWGVEDYHPSNEERIKKIEEYRDEWKNIRAVSSRRDGDVTRYRSG